MHMMFSCYNKQGGFVVSDHDWVPEVEVLRMFELELAAGGDVAAPGEGEPLHELEPGFDLEECPWILDLLGPHAHPSTTAMTFPSADEGISVHDVHDHCKGWP